MRALPHARYRGSALSGSLYTGVVLLSRHWGSLQAPRGAVFVASPKRRLRFHAAAFAAPSGRAASVAAACSRAYASRIAAAGAAARAAACSRAYASRIAAPHAAGSGIAASRRASSSPSRRRSCSKRRSMAAFAFAATAPDATRCVVSTSQTAPHLCGNQKFTARAESSRRPPRHRRDACSMAWRCRFLATRPSQDGRVIAEK
jgi:hypothetical protein